jgi:hypothetical protein
LWRYNVLPHAEKVIEDEGDKIPFKENIGDGKTKENTLR